jgi:hypothetical protein
LKGYNKNQIKKFPTKTSKNFNLFQNNNQRFPKNIPITHTLKFISLISSGCDRYYYKYNRFASIDEGERRFQIKEDNGWQYVMIVRDPIERFLSGYLHMCYYGQISSCAHHCNRCGTNLWVFSDWKFQILKNVGNFWHLEPASWNGRSRTWWMWQGQETFQI